MNMRVVVNTSPGNFACDEGLVTTNNSNSPITFTFNPGVKSIGGNIFATDLHLEAITARIKVTLTDGSAYVGYSKSAADFMDSFPPAPPLPA